VVRAGINSGVLKRRYFQKAEATDNKPRSFAKPLNLEFICSRFRMLDSRGNSDASRGLQLLISCVVPACLIGVQRQERDEEGFPFTAPDTET